MYKLTKYGLLSLLFLFCACVTNDFKPEYQKEVKYDGNNGAFDTICITTYTASIVNGIPTKSTLFSKITKWYDLNGYHSMTEAIAFSGDSQQKTVEQITRDKYSLPVARNIVIESPNTEPLVTLARLKTRKEGQEKWLYRHYFDSKKYLEDAATIFYTDTERRTKKKHTNIDSLSLVEIEIFNNNGRLISKTPFEQEKQLPHKQTFYNSLGTIDSVVSIIYEMIEVEHEIRTKQVETYRYEFDNNENISKSYIYLNDSLTYISEYKYSGRD